MGIVEEIRQFIQQGKIKQALNKLNEWAENNDEDIFNTSIILLSRFNQLERNSQIGIIDDRDAERSRNRIAYSVLSTLDDIKIQAAPQPSAGNRAKKVFISYAREDRTWVDKLEQHLAPLQRKGLIDSWDDSQIAPGTEWDESIMEALEAADIYIFMVSPDFIGSDFINRREVPAAMQRNRPVVPVIIRSAYWEEEPYSKFQALPTNAKPIATWDNEDAAFLEVVRGLAKILKN